VFRHPEENMVALKRKMDLIEISGKPDNPGKSRKEMIEKKVKPSGNSGRVYLPQDWVGKHVKIIRID